MMNENAISNILVDVDFLEDEFKKNGRPQLMAAFAELRAVSPATGLLIAASESGPCTDHPHCHDRQCPRVPQPQYPPNHVCQRYAQTSAGATREACPVRVSVSRPTVTGTGRKTEEGSRCSWKVISWRESLMTSAYSNFFEQHCTTPGCTIYYCPCAQSLSDAGRNSS